MNMLLAKLLGRYLRDEESGAGDSGSAPAASSSDSAGEAVDWGALNDGVEAGADDEGDGEGSEAPASAPAPAPAPAAPQAPAATPTTPEAQAPADPTQQAQQPVETPPEQQQAPEQTPEQKAAAQAESAKRFTEWRQAEVDKLTKAYSFDDETAQRLQTEPELILPQLAAELELRATERALAAVQQMIPQMIPQVVNSTAAEKQATDFFYGKNPDLRQYHNQVMQAGALFRQMNPKASPEETAKKVGEIVRTSLGLPAVAAAPAPTPTPGKPAVPPKPAAAGSRGSGAAPAKGDGSVWADLAADDD